MPPCWMRQFVAAMKRAYLILSDSGGVQEEAPALGKPVLVLRHEIERPEAVREGVVKLVGTDFDAIVSEAQQLLDDKSAHGKMARGVSPYGDGYAAERIVKVLRDHFSQFCMYVQSLSRSIPISPLAVQGRSDIRHCIDG